MKKKIFIVGVILIITIISAVVAVFAVKNSISNDEEKQKETLNTFISYINDKKYEDMYSLISSDAKGKIAQEDFIKRNKNIYEGIDAEDIKIQNTRLTNDNGKKGIEYTEEFYTAAGKVEFSNAVKLHKENGEYKIDWSSQLIFPDLGDSDKVRISNIKAKRGSIIDRNGNNLAYDGFSASVGIVPGKLGENKDEDIVKISELLGVSAETINKYLSASYVKDDTFVPIKKVSNSNTELKEKLLSISGIMINKADSRVYNLGEEAGHLIGYVQTINADELKSNEGKGYTSTSLIGKSGIEMAYEETLRGIDGTEIYIENTNGEKIKTITKQDKKDGTDVKLTIDSDIQAKLYGQLKDDKGLFVVMEPQTGELLALVSTPTFNSNDFALGMTNDKWNSLLNNPDRPLYNKFLQSYCPGSTFKPITGAIGLTTNKVTLSDVFAYSGTKWQKDSSWKDYFITTLTAYSGAKNMRNAIIHSDNIYFAQAALKIGRDTLVDNLNKLGFNENLEFPLGLTKSQYLSSGNSFTDAKLANTGYGQGDVLVNPIHMAAIYSSFANEGNMIKPYIEYNENEKGTVLKKNVFSAEAATTIKDYLIQVVENPEGTAPSAKTTGLTIAGKTGTAELKTSKDDIESGVLAWFDCFTTNRVNQNLLIIGMVENTQNNSSGGSSYIIKKIKTIL